MSVSEHNYMPVVCNLQEFSTQLPTDYVLPVKAGGWLLHRRSLCLSTIT
jgi:hypothetical protein